MKNGVRFKRGERRDRKQKIIFYISLLSKIGGENIIQLDQIHLHTLGFQKSL